MKKSFSPRQLAQAVGVSESSLKRWADAGRLHVVKTTGGHRRIPIAEAVRFIRETGLTLLKPQVLGLSSDAAPISEGRNDPRQLMQALLTAGDADAVRDALASAFADGYGVARLCDEWLAPALEEIGTFWRHGSEGIFIEHRAVDCCLVALSHLRALLPRPARDAPVAMGSAPVNDPYILPCIMAATVLAELGWRVINLGPQCPLQVLENAAQQHHARLLWLSCSVPVTVAAAQQLAQLAQRLRQQNRVLVVGGRGWSLGAGTRSRMQLDIGANMGELRALAQGVMRGLTLETAGDA